MSAITVLVVEADEERRALLRRAWEESGIGNDLRFLSDGAGLMDYLRRRGEYEAPLSAPHPGLILLDLNVPPKGVGETLREVKADPDLRSIPVIVLASSRAEEDVLLCYDLGANSYVTKPMTFAGLVEAMRALGAYWFETAQLPPQDG